MTVINQGKNVHLGTQLFRDMRLTLMDTEVPLSDDEFEPLPHIGWDKNAPVPQALKRSRGYFRFRMPPYERWMLGLAVDRRNVHCWKVEFTPFVSSRDEFTNDFVREVGRIMPDMATKVGTLVGSKMMTSVLDIVPEYVLWEWLEYKERQKRGGH